MRYYGFKREISGRSRKCSECGKRIAAGDNYLTSRWPSESLIKAVCSEDCRLEFEAELFLRLAEARQLRAARMNDAQR